jgi:hypothetical protein
MLSRNVLIPGALVASFAAGALLWSTLASGQDPRDDLLDHLPDPPGEVIVVATVNDVPILQHTLEGGLVLARTHDPTAQAADLLDALIDDELLFQEGQRRGLTPSGDEIDDAIATTRRGIDPADMDIALTYAARSGTPLTEDEYWASDGVRAAVARSITVGRTRDALKGTDPVRSGEQLAAAIAELRANARITIDEDVLSRVQ